MEKALSMTKGQREPVAAIIMASGFSKRMGRNKLMLRLEAKGGSGAAAAAANAAEANAAAIAAEATAAAIAAAANVAAAAEATATATATAAANVAATAAEAAANVAANATGSDKPAGLTVIEYVMDQAASIGYDPLIVVSQYGQILIWAEERGLYPVNNPYAAEGKSSSIRIGASVLETMIAKGEFPPPAGITFITGDQILLSAGLLQELKETFLEHPDRIVFPSYGGKPGSPATFPLDMLPRLKELEGEEGGMIAARERKERILLVPAEPAWQGMDFDTMEDWEKALALWRTGMSLPY